MTPEETLEKLLERSYYDAESTTTDEQDAEFARMKLDAVKAFEIKEKLPALLLAIQKGKDDDICYLAHQMESILNGVKP